MTIWESFVIPLCNVASFKDIHHFVPGGCSMSQILNSWKTLATRNLFTLQQVIMKLVNIFVVLAMLLVNITAIIQPVSAADITDDSLLVLDKNPLQIYHSDEISSASEITFSDPITQTIAGESFALSVAALDDFGIITTTYTSTVSFSSSDANQLFIYDRGGRR